MTDRQNEPTLRDPLPHSHAHPFDPAPPRVRNYRIIRRIGEGGMGEVYEAEQLEPVHRQVALKLIKAGMDSKQIIARFAVCPARRGVWTRRCGITRRLLQGTVACWATITPRP
jgi:serine/threonine protein kinase